MKAYENLHSLRSFQSFKPWIMKIVLRQAYNLAGRRQKIVYMDDLEIEEVTDAETMAEDSRELWQVVHLLEEEFRLTTILYYYEDMSVKDIAKTLDLPVGTVKSRLARAREKLKGLLTVEGGRKDG
ncbi:RNA polymerase sigma factor [Desulfosporosinus orientis]|uniref:RNA polymerase sigma factor n=1 Tax=Desulfosporosinus orientis TaxID=1563 RepID=UPI0002EDA4C0|nr:sigma-70 family RNA polymerase sigma factor [Desulfosporosinus orientis]